MAITGVKPSLLDVATIAALQAKLGVDNHLEVFNIKHYGAVGDNNTDNTAAIQYTIDLAHVNGGTVYVPAGIFKTHALITYRNVSIVGDITPQISELRSIAAETMISLVNTVFNRTTSGLHNLYLNGNYVGTIGYYMQYASTFSFSNCIFANFVTYQMKLSGTLAGCFYNCRFYGDITGATKPGIGLFAERDNAHGWAPNLLTFYHCQWIFNYLAVQFTCGAAIKFQSCDFEVNGVGGDASSGCVKYANFEGISNTFIIGLEMDDCWIDANFGTMINIADNNFATKNNLNVISNCIFISNTIASASDIVVTTSVSMTKTILRSCSLGDIGNAIILNGANTVLINEKSYLTGSVVPNAGTYTMPINADGYLIPSFAAAPATPIEGMIYANTTDHHSYYYNGTIWKQLDN